MALDEILWTLSNMDLDISLSFQLETIYIFQVDVNKCWDCNGDHGVKKCKLSQNQAQIEVNKKKWEEKRGSLDLTVVALVLGHNERSSFGKRTVNICTVLSQILERW